MQIDLPIDVFTYPDTPLPDVWTVEQKFTTPSLTPEQIEAEVRRALGVLEQDARLRPGTKAAAASITWCPSCAPS
jgi:hypothetical protein